MKQRRFFIMIRAVVLCIPEVLLVCAPIHAEESAGMPGPFFPPSLSLSPPPFPLEWVRLVPTETIKASEKGPVATEIIIREEPSETAKPLGIIRAKIAEKKVAFEFQPDGAATAIPFTPDLFLDGHLRRPNIDDNYRHPWRNQTILHGDGDWVQVPPKPWAKAGWIE